MLITMTSFVLVNCFLSLVFFKISDSFSINNKSIQNPYIPEENSVFRMRKITIEMGADKKVAPRLALVYRASLHTLKYHFRIKDSFLH